MDIRISLSGECPSDPPLLNLAGVGLVRGEFLFRDREVYVTNEQARADLATYVSGICRVFAGKPVWYRLSDFWSDEANVLQGNPHIEDEANPIVGMRGIRRVLAYPQDFALEVEEIAGVARTHPNLHLLFPFVQDGDEMADGIQLCRRAGWRGRFGSMIETPSAIFCAADIVKAGATNLLVGLNDLTCLLLARERGSNEMKLHHAVWKAVAVVRDSVSGTEWGIAGSLSRDIIRRAENFGVPYVSVHYGELPDVLGVPPVELVDLDFVRRVKEKTRAAKRRRMKNTSSVS